MNHPMNPDLVFQKSASTAKMADNIVKQLSIELEELEISFEAEEHDSGGDYANSLTGSQDVTDEDDEEEGEEDGDESSDEEFDDDWKEFVCDDSDDEDVMDDTGFGISESSKETLELTNTSIVQETSTIQETSIIEETSAIFTIIKNVDDDDADKDEKEDIEWSYDSPVDTLFSEKLFEKVSKKSKKEVNLEGFGLFQGGMFLSHIMRRSSPSPEPAKDSTAAEASKVDLNLYLDDNASSPPLDVPLTEEELTINAVMVEQNLLLLAANKKKVEEANRKWNEGIALPESSDDIEVSNQNVSFCFHLFSSI